MSHELAHGAPQKIDEVVLTSTMWLLGELGTLLFYSPGFWDVGGLLRARSSPVG